jgi:DNA polymerase-1
MEYVGVRLNTKGWCRVADRQKQRMFRMQKKISDILAPKGTAMSLFEELPSFKVTDDQIKKRCKELGIQLPVVVNRKTKEPERDKKTGDVKVTVSMDALEPIKDQHPLFPMIIKHAGLKKAWTSYGYNYLDHINPADGRIHPSFKQIGTETGRFACKDPNLQQIPQELIYRRNFISGDGNELGWADYSQIELRILAEMTQDAAMIAAFKSGKDFHTATAASLFGVDINHVTPAQRRLAKDINFGVVYGIGAARFAASAKITVEEAEAILTDYFNTYVSLKAWLDEARRKGAVDREVRTMSGRLFRPKFDDNDRQARSLAERNGMNMPIQGTSADMTKIAMALLKRRSKGISWMVNVAHDEIITEYKIENREVATKLLVDCMVEAGEVFLKTVPVKVELKTGLHWSK